MRSFRTYRLLRFIVAASLVAAVTLPLVRYICAKGAMPMAEIMAVADKATGGMPAGYTNHTPANAPCGGDVARAETCPVHGAEACPEEAPCDTAQCAAEPQGAISCCALEAAHSDAKTVLEAKSPSAKVFLPLVAVLVLPEPTRLKAYPSLAHDLHGDVSGRVSLRVLHASFLI